LFDLRAGTMDGDLAQPAAPAAEAADDTATSQQPEVNDQTAVNTFQDVRLCSRSVHARSSLSRAVLL
jgi:hypothetical protein